MEILIGAFSAALLMIFLVQVGRARELVSTLRNDPDEEYKINNTQGALGLIFGIVLLVATGGSFVYYTSYIFGWGPNTAASEHGPVIDRMFNTTLLLVAIVFFITQFLLFYFAWKYRGRKNGKAIFWAHNEKLEMVWMMVPAVTLTFLVVSGLQAWNDIMIDKGDHDVEVEATGMQFAWLFRYPGRDGKLGSRHFTKIDEKVEVYNAALKGTEIIKSNNPIGQDWTDEANIDDFSPGELVLQVGKKVRVRILSRDVLHSFYLPQFRVKMDAVPGVPTYFIFTPTITTDSMRSRLKDYPDWQRTDKLNDQKKRWETFNYELACAELCGKGHFSMAKLVKVVEEDAYIEWLGEQEDLSPYIANVRGKSFDPFKDQKELNFEKLLAQKNIVRDAKNALIAAMEDSPSKKDDCKRALTSIKPLYHTVVTTTDLKEAESAAQKALQYAKVVLPSYGNETKVEEPAEGDVETPAQDSVTTK